MQSDTLSSTASQAETRPTSKETISTPLHLQQPSVTSCCNATGSLTGDNDNPVLSAWSAGGTGCRGALCPGEQALISCSPLIVDPQILATGIDTLELALRLDIPAGLLQKLATAKKEVQETTDDAQLIQFGETTLFTWNLSRTGVSLYPYVLRTGDITFCLSTRAADSSIMNARLKIGSISCNNGLDDILTRLRTWAARYGIKWIEEKVSRLDVFTDIETPISTTGIELESHHIARSRKYSCFHENRKLTGIQLGSSEIVFRAYDKVQEMKTKRSTEKAIFFISLWGHKPEHVTRVEFQLRRQAIKELCPGRTDFAVVRLSLPGIYAYLTQDWLRVAQENVDPLRENNNQHLAETSAFWKIVQAAVDLLAKKYGQVKQITRGRQQKHINVTALLDQAAGLMLTISAAAGHAAEDVFGIITTCRDALQAKISEHFERPDFERQFESRIASALVTF